METFWKYFTVFGVIINLTLWVGRLLAGDMSLSICVALSILYLCAPYLKSRFIYSFIVRHSSCMSAKWLDRVSRVIGVLLLIGNTYVTIENIIYVTA